MQYYYSLITLFVIRIIHRKVTVGKLNIKHLYVIYLVSVFAMFIALKTPLINDIV
jgi:hypothetical protein